jgi:hypothetical protein
MTRDGKIDTSALAGPPHTDPVCIRGRLGIGLDEWTPQQWREHGACVRAAAYEALAAEHPLKASQLTGQHEIELSHWSRSILEGRARILHKAFDGLGITHTIRWNGPRNVVFLIPVGQTLA